MKRPLRPGAAGQVRPRQEGPPAVEHLVQAGRAGTVLPKSAWRLGSARWSKELFARCAVYGVALWQANNR
jgi:hypothetical protein